VLLGSVAFHQSWIIFVGTLFLGESVLIAYAALSAQGGWSVTTVAVWAFAGTLVADTAWFLSARKGLSRWTSDPARSSRLARLATFLDRFTGPRPYRALLVAKFFYGSRVAAIAYMALRGVKTGRFLVFDAIGTVLWLAVMIPIGRAVGAGLGGFEVDIKRVQWVVLVAVLGVVAVKGAVGWRAQRGA